MAIQLSFFRKIYVLGFALIMALPLVSVQPLFHPPSFAKAIVFRTILCLMLFVFLIDMFFVRKKELFAKIEHFKQKSPFLFYSFALLFAAFLVSTIFSVDVYFSFWGTPYRGGGFLNILFYFIFAFFLFLTLSKKDWKTLWNISFTTGAIASLIVIFQQFGIFSNWLISYENRPVSTMGNPNFFGAYVLFLFFPALGLFFKEKGKKKIVFGGMLLLYVFAAFLTLSRGVYLGLLIGGSYFVFLFFEKRKKTRIIFILALITGIVLFFYGRGALSSVTFSNNILEMARQRVVNISLKGAASRISAWKISWQAIKQKPIWGWGIENFSIAFNKHYDPDLPNIGLKLGSDWWDRAHNILFDIGVACGIPGIIAYLSCFYFLISGLQKAKKYNPEKKIVLHSTQAALIAYFTVNLTSFDVFSTYLMLFFVSAFSFYLISCPQPSQKKQGNAPFSFSRQNKLLIILFFALTISFIYFCNLRLLLINKEINLALYYAGNENYEKALAKIEPLLLKKSPLNYYLRAQYASILGSYVQKNPPHETELNEKLTDTLRQNVKIRPLSFRDWFYLSTHLRHLIVRHNDKETIMRLAEEADRSFKEAEKLSPKRQEIYMEWSGLYLAIKNFEETKNKAEQCLLINPENEVCLWRRGLAYIASGEIDMGQKFLSEAIQRGQSGKSREATAQLINAYAEALKYEKKQECYRELKKLYQTMIKIEPEEYKWHAYLATAYKELGETEKARQEALKMLELAPHLRENVNAFLQTL